MSALAAVARAHAERRAEAPSDPIARGFNYGAPYRAAPYSLLYAAVDAAATGLRDEAGRIEREAWEADMLLRNVRHATTQAAYEEAEAVLREWARAHDISLGATGAGDHAALLAISGLRVV